MNNLENELIKPDERNEKQTDSFKTYFQLFQSLALPASQKISKTNYRLGPLPADQR